MTESKILISPKLDGFSWFSRQNNFIFHSQFNGVINFDLNHLLSVLVTGLDDDVHTRVSIGEKKERKEKKEGWDKNPNFAKTWWIFMI